MHILSQWLKPRTRSKAAKAANRLIPMSKAQRLTPRFLVSFFGQGDADYAQVQNFNPATDSIMLTGDPNQYKFEPKDGNVRITTTSGDLVAIVEGTSKLQVEEIDKDFGVFVVK
jgi:hypothetical protein